MRPLRPSPTNFKLCGAEAEFKRAVELNPADADAWIRYAEFSACMGRREESITLATRAVNLEPVSVGINTTLAWVLFLARRYEEAIARCRDTVELGANQYRIYMYLGNAYAGQGKCGSESHRRRVARAQNTGLLLAVDVGVYLHWSR